ncbi:hypothetical protein MKW92_034371, partial [Papaver armeniacum]
KIFRDEFRVFQLSTSLLLLLGGQCLQVAAKKSITAGVPTSLNPPRWTGFVPSAVYLLLLEKKLVHPPLHKPSLKISCKSNVSSRK